jgi:hypothetical protein
MRRITPLALAVAALLTCQTATAQSWFLEERTKFAPPLADPHAPVHYMGVYMSPPVDHTRTSDTRAGAAEATGGNHVFWDVGFGEEFGLLGDENWSLFVHADVHMLLDFFSHSGAVLTTDFRLGGGVQGQLPTAQWLGWRLRFFHESTHVGDEYLDNAWGQREEGNAEYDDFRRVNVSFEAVEAGVDANGHLPRTRNRVKWRTYAMYRFLLRGPWLTHPGALDTEIAGPKMADRHEGQLGGELRYGTKWCRGPCPSAIVAGADLTLRRQYDYTGTAADRRFVTLHGMAGFEWQSATTLRALLTAHDGINPRGQFRDESLRYVGLVLQLDR